MLFSNRRIRLCVAGAGVIFAACHSHAEPVVHIKKSFESVALDVSGLRHVGSAAARAAAQTLIGDLKRAGWVTIAAAEHAIYRVEATWEEKHSGLQAVIRVRTINDRDILNRRYNAGRNEERAMAHRIADEIVYELTGHKGIAATRIVMVGASGSGKELYLFDADGGRMRRLTSDHSVSLSPRWGPGGRRLVYTSFKSAFPDVYLIDLSAGHRERIAKFPGLNSGADFAPDGKDIVLTLSKDGNPELYIMTLRSGKLSRLTRTARAGETSPTFSPDGKQIAFVSDSSGLPQVYVMSRRGGGRTRLTLEGRENVAPDWGLDGRIAYASRRYGRYQICVYDPKTRSETQVTREHVDHEDPSWAPNGRHLVYTRTENYASRVYILDTVSGASIPLHRADGSWYTPAWSPN